MVTSTVGSLSWSNGEAPSGAWLTGAQFVGSDTLMIGGLGVLTGDLITAPLP